MKKRKAWNKGLKNPYTKETIKKMSESAKKKIFTKKHRENISKAFKKEKHPGWIPIDKYKRVTKHGYILVKHPLTKKIVYEHRYLMEKHLGRKLSKSEVVHHINKIKTDNRLENLIIMNDLHHLSHHSKEQVKRGMIVPCDMCGKKIYRSPYRFN